MFLSDPSRAGLTHAFRAWWRDRRAREGSVATVKALLAEISGLVRDSTPQRRRQRYGDIDYDWDYRVDTTGATVSWRDRLVGVFHSPYQPTEPALFHEMLGSLDIDHRKFTFIDLGAGKGRVLLMAADYPFEKILGVELLPELNRIAQQNIQRFKSSSQRCFELTSICGDASEFEFPPEPLVLYLFNPFPETGLRGTIANLESSIRRHPRSVYVIYHNPLLETVLATSHVLEKIGGTHQYSVYAACRSPREESVGVFKP